MLGQSEHGLEFISKLNCLGHRKSMLAQENSQKELHDQISIDIMGYQQLLNLEEIEYLGKAVE